MKRVFAQFLLVFLLLAGQQSALDHSVWHIQDQLPAHGQGDGAAAPSNDDGHPSQSRLCDLHGILGALLAGDCGSQAAVPAFDTPGIVACCALVRRTALSAATPPSRAPPAFS